MRTAFVSALRDLARRNPEVVFLTGDLGFGVVESFADELPEQFFNMGAAEQNMVGVATGLAKHGFVPFTYSIINFSVLRPFEVIRNGPVAHKLPVRIVGVGPGFEYGTNGPTHYGLEDIACLRSLGDIDIVVPADPARAAQALHLLWNDPNPIYFRLGKDDRIFFPELTEPFAQRGFSRVPENESGNQPTTVGVVCLGTSLGQGLRARRLLATEGIHVALFCVERITKRTIAALVDELDGFQHIVTVEAHSPRGGFGSALTEELSERGGGAQVRRLGIDRPPTRIGRQHALEQLAEFDADAICAAVRRASDVLAV